MTLSIIALHIECHYAECHLCLMLFMLGVANTPFMLRVFMLNVVMTSVVAPRVLLNLT